MTPETTRHIWDLYSKVWTDISPAERELMMREILTDDVTYTAPDAQGRGIASFATVIEAFQCQYPGAYFHTEQLIAQHDQSLTTWTMHDRHGATLLTGSSYARFNDMGQIEHLAGFWDASGL